MSNKPKKMKKYIAMSVWLPVKPELAAANGSKQFCICVNAPTKKRVVELLNVIGCGGYTLSSLNSQNGLWVNDDYKFNPPEDEVIYFHNEHLGTPHCGEWLKLTDWRR